MMMIWRVAINRTNTYQKKETVYNTADKCAQHFQDQYPGATLRTLAIFEFDRETVCTSGDILFLFQRELLRPHTFQQTWVTIGRNKAKNFTQLLIQNLHS
jgi:hypothetical protein